jgi:ankyrin repeat protein
VNKIAKWWDTFCGERNVEMGVSDVYGSKPFNHAIQQANREIFDLFMQYGAEVNGSNFSEAATRMYAGEGRLVMLDLGFDPSTLDHLGQTGLHLICGSYNDLELHVDKRLFNSL